MSEKSELAAALARCEFPPIPKNCEGQIGHRKYKYADLPSILAIVTPILSDNGLAVTQPGHIRDDGTQVLLTKLTHAESGQCEVSQFIFPAMGDDPQEFGIRMTYLRRYALNAILGICPDDDDDGAGARDKAKKTKTTPKQEKSNTGDSEKFERVWTRDEMTKSIITKLIGKTDGSGGEGHDLIKRWIPHQKAYSAKYSRIRDLLHVIVDARIQSGNNVDEWVRKDLESIWAELHMKIEEAIDDREKMP